MVLLAVANALSGVRFYQYNGWRFVPTTVQHHSGPLAAGVTALRAINWNGTVLMAVTNQEPQESSEDAYAIYRLLFAVDHSLQVRSRLEEGKRGLEAGMLVLMIFQIVFTKQLLDH